MGAALDYRTYKTDDRKAIKRKFSEACDDARHESGHGGYTGTIAEMNGVGKWRDREFATVNEAADFLDEHHEKWEPAMAVSFKLSDGTTGWVVGGLCSE